MTRNVDIFGIDRLPYRNHSFGTVKQEQMNTPSAADEDSITTHLSSIQVKQEQVNGLIYFISHPPGIYPP